MTPKVRLCTATEDSRWDAYVQSSPHAHTYHLAAWRRIIETTFGHRAYYFVAEDHDGRITGVLPVVRLRSVAFGDFMVSVPYVNYGGSCAEDEATTRALVVAASRTAAEERVHHLEIRMSGPAEFGLQSRSAKVSVRLPLPASSEDLWKGFPSKLRSQIKRAQQEDMTVHVGREDQLDAFYEVFAANMRDLGTPVYARKFFATLLSTLPESTHICSVRLRGEPVAAGFLIGFRKTLEIPWASSLRRYSRLSPNMLLYWSVLKFACERGYNVFDFGRSSPESGPHRFKMQWGGTPIALSWHYWMGPGADLPDFSPKNPKYQLAIRVWQRLPVAVTKIIGPPIVKGLP
jgi:serine/alanine adding enzyme